MTWLVNIVILSVLAVFSFSKRLNLKSWRWLFLIVALLEIILLADLTKDLYLLWESNELSKYLLPPYGGLGYFFFYTGTRIWAPYFVSWLTGLLAYWLTWLLNKRGGGRFFYNEELYFLWLGLFLSGHPGWIVYFILILAMGLLFTSLRAYQLTSLYYLWFPVGIAAILINQWLSASWNLYGNLFI